MFEFWSRELRKIEDFISLNKHCFSESQPVSILGLSKAADQVELHVISAKQRPMETVYVNVDELNSQRNQMKQGLAREESLPLWSRQVILGKREIPVLSAQSTALYPEQMKASWLLAESLRLGWDGRAFNDYHWASLMLTTFTLDIDWTEVSQLNFQEDISLIRDKTFENFLLEKTVELRVQQSEAVKVTLYANGHPNEIRLQELRLCDVWAEMEAVYDHHRRNSTMSVEMLEKVIEEQLKNLEKLCPRGLRLPVVIYEAEPMVSIQCYTSAFLESPVIASASGEASAMGILMGLKDEFGPRGYPLKAAAIQEAVSSETKTLEVEVFSAQVQVPHTPLVFK